MSKQVNLALRVLVISSLKAVLNCYNTIFFITKRAISFLLEENMKESYAVKELQAFRRYAYHKHRKELIRAFIWKMLNKHYHNKVASDYE